MNGDLFQPRPKIFVYLEQIDPKPVLFKEEDWNHLATVFAVEWHALGLRWTSKQMVSDEVMSRWIMGEEMEAYVNRHLIDGVVCITMEAYVEFWHLYYEGDMSLKDFCEMTLLESVEYVRSNGDYIPGRNDYARVCRLQQRDSGRFADTERLVRENS